MNHKEIGRAGELLVASDLIKKGFRVLLTVDSLPFDLVVLLNNGEYKKIQVKSTRKKWEKNNVYCFQTKKGTHDNRKKYKKTDTDWFAFAALDINKIAYIPATKIDGTMLKFRTKENSIDIKNNKIPFIEDFPFHE